MKDKINIAELLKDCPKGMELDCTMYDNVQLDDVIDGHLYPIKIQTSEGKTSLTKDGCYSFNPHCKCAIFPKGKTTWEGFQRPFKDGDVVFYSNTIAIFKEWGDETLFRTHCVFYPTVSNPAHQFEIGRPLFGKGIRRAARFATEEERQKLVETIIANGYKWDTETWALEKLEDIEDKGNISDGYHTFNELYEYRLLYNASLFNELAKQGLYDVHKSKKHSDGTIPFGDENWFIVMAELPTGQISNHYEMRDWDLFNVPEKEKANPYDGHSLQDVVKRLRDFLTLKESVKPKFKVGDRIRKENNSRVYTINGVYSSMYGVEELDFGIPIEKQDDWELVPNKFDITTLKPFESRVLVRDDETFRWSPATWWMYDGSLEEYNYIVEGGNGFNMLIPYEGNEHLLGTTNNCDDFYKNWE